MLNIEEEFKLFEKYNCWDQVYEVNKFSTFFELKICLKLYYSIQILFA